MKAIIFKKIERTPLSPGEGHLNSNFTSETTTVYFMGIVIFKRSITLLL